MTNENNVNKELEQKDEELVEMINGVIDMAGNYYKKTKARLFTRGLVIGALSAVAIQSIITILVLMK